jgi:phage tail-like protein
MAERYPPVSFYFEVWIAGIKTPGDSSFLEADGLSMDREFETIREGGENRFAHRVPGRMKFENLILKRGLMLYNSALAVWCRESMECDLGTAIKTKDIYLSLLDPKGSPQITWNFRNAWPVKWSVEGFNAVKNDFAVEKLEFAYSYFSRAD